MAGGERRCRVSVGTVGSGFRVANCWKATAGTANTAFARRTAGIRVIWMSDHSMPESLVEKHGPFCDYCGLPHDSHPVEYSPMNEKDGYLCEEPKDE